ncbi:MAG TPA: metallophosphoesterase [Anaerolineales bacterium]|nr:metallophosphoesterase [Anaerolineales bacterium]
MINDGKKLTRRDFLKFLWHGFLGSTLLAAGGVGYSVFVEPSLFSVETIRLKLKKLPKSFSGLRVAQISDIHMGGWMNLDRFQQVADLVVAEKPDILLITGDFLLGHRFTDDIKQALDDLTKVLSPLAESIPSFAVLGNHDYWVDAEAVRKMLSLGGVIELTNTVFTLRRGNDNLHLCGVDDVWDGDVRLEDVIARLEDDNVAILLAHEPDYADVSAVTGKFDLQVSGHTQGGQVVIPFLGPPILPYLGQKYHTGLYKVRNMFQYTNRGVGMNRLAVRFNCRPEITIFVLDQDV